MSVKISPKNISQGSQFYEYKCAQIAAAAKVVVRISEQFPNARIFEPLDYIEFINNSAVSITIGLSGEEPYTIPPYMIKPFSKKPYREFSITNLSATTAIATSEVIVHCQRMPADFSMGG